MAQLSTFFFGTGRTALKAGLLQLDFKPGSCVLVPDFICDVLLHPILDSDLVPIFYPLTDQLSPDWRTLELLVAEFDSVALFVVHYFGQPQDLGLFRHFCLRHHLILIEDNAHGYGGVLHGQPLGSFGDIGFSSPRKQLGTPSGGVLYTHYHLHSSFTTNLPSYPILRPKPILKMLLRDNKRFSYISKFFNRQYPDSASPLAYSSSVERYYSIDTFSHMRIVSTDWSIVAFSRRQNWSAWSIFAINHGLRPVFPSLHPQSCPWAVPFYARDLSDRNYWLSWGKKQRISLFPWPSLCKPVVLSNASALERWKRLVCFLLDFQPPQPEP